MYSAKEIANYFLQLDKNNSLFNTKLMKANGRTFYEGNARLNKYLHLAKNIYYAKFSTYLFMDDLYAFDNGAVVPSIQENYALLLAKKNEVQTNINEKDQEFLDKLFVILHDAPIEKLIDLSHEDSAWKDKHMYYRKDEQIMDTSAHLDEYKEQYDDVIQLMDRMSA